MKIQKDIYQPNKYTSMNFFTIWLSMFNDIAASFSLGYRLFLRDFRAKYQQQLFGVLWVIFIPIIAVLSFTLLSKASVINISQINAPYPVYAFLGVTFWGVIQSIISLETGILNISGAFIKQINFSREALLFSPVLISLLDLVIKLVLFIIICFLYQYPLNPFNLIYLFALIPLILLSIGIGMFLSITGAVIKDITSIMTYIFQFLLFITPVMYNKPDPGTFLGKLTEMNPLYYLTVVPRDLILFGQTTQIRPYFYCTLISLLIFLLGWRFFKVAVARIVEKI